MPVPAKRRPSNAKLKRRSHHALKKVVLAKCSQCGKAVAPHTACGFCGNYRGKTVLKVKEKVAKKDK